MLSVSSPRAARLLPWMGALLFCVWGAALAQETIDPPGRVAHVSVRQGSVVYAPQGEEEWSELPQNQPLTEGDRLWTDAGARAELQLGTATLHVNSETQLGLSSLDERAGQFMLQQGTVNARVREVLQGENFEVDTPNVAVRALQPGDFRIDVDPRSQQTRVTVNTGNLVVFGESGDSVQMGAGQQATFSGRSLAQVRGQPAPQDDFAGWAEERNRVEDQAVASRYVPRGVVGATELDSYGTWNHDQAYGPVWYPAVTVQNWAPYRYGHWSWIAPWGWTWIDDAPWGFAPFHYGRWTMIGNRWAWVPGRLAARPVYAPALVVFLGGGSQFSLGAGPAVGWYPLAPGEAWYPWYRTSPRYVTHANQHINLHAWPRNASNHVWRQRSFAVTSVREDDFRRGRPVERHWQPVQPNMIDRAQPNVVPVRPQGRPGRSADLAPQLRATPFAGVRPTVSPHGWSIEVPRAVREQIRAQNEQDRLQRQAVREAREQIREQHEQRLNAQRNAGRVDFGQSQRDAGRVDPGQPQRNAGRVDFGQSQRNAGRVEIDQGGQFQRPEAPRMHRQAQSPPVAVPRQEAVPIVREERGNGRFGRAPVAEPGEVRGGRGHEGHGHGRGHGNR